MSIINPVETSLRLVSRAVPPLIALIVAFFTIGITDAVHFPPMNFIDAANAANIPMWLMSMLLFFAVGIPFFFVFYLGLKILVNNLKSIGNVAKFTLLGLWLMAIIGLVITGVKQATEHAFDAKVTIKEQLDVKANDTLKLSMIGNHSYGDYLRRHDNNYRLTEEDNGRTITSSDIRLVVKSTKDSCNSISVFVLTSLSPPFKILKISCLTEFDCNASLKRASIVDDGIISPPNER